jgi:prepilin-type N-terminal cleavage/methylation domain-containing protein
VPIRPARPRPNGFTLVEVLVALVVSSLLLAIVMDGALSARSRARLTEDRREAVLLARELIAQTSVAPYSGRVHRGSRDALAWQVAETPAMVDPRRRFILAAIRVDVIGRNGAGLITVHTRRLKPTTVS